MGEGNLTLALSRLSNEARTVVSRLNSKRLFPSDGPGNLPRDFRGLAFCINVMGQDLDNVSQNQTEWLLRRWLDRGDGTATVQQLFEYLELIDRYDIKDDLLELDRKQKLINTESACTVDSQETAVARISDEDLVTLEEFETGAPVVYDALVLYAEADKDFVQLMIDKMSNDFGLKLCTKHSLRPGMMPFPMMTELIRSRCRYVILVYSPDFFISPDDKFYMDYVHAWNINTNGRRLLPCMYRQCTLPPHYSFYHNIYYNSVAYNFWTQLGRCLTVPRNPRIAAPSPPSPALRIKEIEDKKIPNGFSNHLANGHASTGVVEEPTTQTLLLPDVPTNNLTVSMTTLSVIDPRPLETASLNDISSIKKKRSITKMLKKPFKLFSKSSKNKSKQILVDYSVSAM